MFRFAAAKLSSRAAFLILGLSGCVRTDARDGVQHYDCATAQPPAAFSVEFQDQARVAVVTASGRTARLTRQGGDGFRDIYVGQGVTLTLDPEAALSGMTPRPLQNCSNTP